MHKRFIVLLMALLLGYAVSAKETKKEYMPESGKPDKKICILYHDSDFRNAVITKLAAELQRKNIYTVADSAFNKKNYPADQYDMVIVFSGIHAFLPDAVPRAYLWDNRFKTNIIHVFCTFLSPKGLIEKHDKFYNVDTITCGSYPNFVDLLVETLYKKLAEKLKLEDPVK